jgi:hypothetical protein
MNAKNIMYTLGVVLLLVGLIGFFNDPVFGIFETDTVHNLVHIVSGILAIGFAAASESAARTYAKVFGIVYGIVLLLGLISPDNTVLGLMEINTADNFLHFFLTAVFLYVGFATAPEMRRAFAARDFDRDSQDYSDREPF